ncbi:MAG: alanine racemase [Desulfurispora sp.]|uniref:alanine racemase n=1 Tax=Desulfurispora sp. TaxID=3014275 RepID=UPI00404B0B70
MSIGPVQAEINLAAIARNIQQIRSLLQPGTRIMGVVKANAYGHGAVPVSRVLLQNGASMLAVARAGEAVHLRQAGITVPILVLGYTPGEMFNELLAYSLTQTVFSLDYARQLDEAAARAGKKLTVHIKVDTGMGRLGFWHAREEALRDVLDIARLPHLEVEGIYTHFAAADSADKTYTEQQIQAFQEFLHRLQKQGLQVALRHCANSAGIIDHPEAHLDLVRPGIILYGLYPSVEVKRERLRLEPAMTFKTRIAQVKEVAAGFSVSYGCTYTTSGNTIIATLPVGYADGYSRLLSARGQVLVRGSRAGIIGRVCMDQCMIDVGHLPGVQPGEEVVLFGRQGQAWLPVEEWASWIGTINYEAVCMVSARVPRVYVED